jgi:hypothetical protein
MRKTLFVLGAGASKPFGLPVGEELRTMIVGGQTSVPTAKVAWYLRQCGYSEPACDEFVRDFKRSGFSIDAFLARRREFDEIGRVAISAALLPNEQDGALYFADGGSDWYRRLWLQLVGSDTTGESLSGRDFKTISFNYDRTFERYLHLTAMASFGLDAVQAYETVKGFFPYHVYGQLGHYNADTVFQLDPPFVRAAAENLKVMPSARPASDDQCQSLITWAERIYFVGFAFDEMNCALLGVLKTVTSARETRPILFATGYGLTRDERRAASIMVSGDPDRLNFYDGVAMDAMRSWAPDLT